MMKANMLDTTSYEHHPEFTKNRRAADFLAWAAVKFPGVFISHSLLAQAVNMLSRMPRFDSTDVRHVRANVTRIRDILENVYGRALDSQKGVGMRATVNDEDRLKTSMPKRARIYVAQQVKFKREIAAININNVPVTADNKMHISWYRAANKVMKEIGSTHFETKLLPPAPEGNEKKQ